MDQIPRVTVHMVIYDADKVHRKPPELNKHAEEMSGVFLADKLVYVTYSHQWTTDKIAYDGLDDCIIGEWAFDVPDLRWTRV